MLVVKNKTNNTMDTFSIPDLYTNSYKGTCG